MFGIGIPELLLILVIGLIFFGPGKLPEIGTALGKSMREFRQAVSGSKTDISSDPAQPEKQNPQSSGPQK